MVLFCRITPSSLTHSLTAQHSTALSVAGTLNWSSLDNLFQTAQQHHFTIIAHEVELCTRNPRMFTRCTSSHRISLVSAAGKVFIGNLSSIPGTQSTHGGVVDGILIYLTNAQQNQSGISDEGVWVGGFAFIPLLWFDDYYLVKMIAVDTRWTIINGRVMVQLKYANKRQV